MEWQDEEEKAERSALPARESATLTKAKRSTRLKYKKKKKNRVVWLAHIYFFTLSASSSCYEHWATRRSKN